MAGTSEASVARAARWEQDRKVAREGMRQYFQVVRPWLLSEIESRLSDPASNLFSPDMAGHLVGVLQELEGLYNRG